MTLAHLQDPPSGGEPNEFECQLLDGFALLVQLLMASIAMSSLFLKRHYEVPRRPFVVWIMDTSKQGFAAATVHVANVAISSITGETSEQSGNPCIWYFLNILLDTTFGVLLLALFLRGLHRLVDYYKMSNMQSGHYGHPPSITAWAKQLVLFLTAWFFVKLTVVILLDVFPFFATFAGWILDPLVHHTGDTKLQVVVVMLIFPLIMNVIQAMLIDQVIKGKRIGRLRSGSFGDASDLESFSRENLIADLEDDLGDFARPPSNPRPWAPPIRRRSADDSLPERPSLAPVNSSQPLLKVQKKARFDTNTSTVSGARRGSPTRTPFSVIRNARYQPLEQEDSFADVDVDLDAIERP
ncbi:hypothetical protein HDU85_004635 [Gaertneriomyces sp. JEL0708]|nr:hypothetical protein HDU85_004635 [Gaertneriomyces sp. JEL0708]